jgi:hypothetical protein
MAAQTTKSSPTEGMVVLMGARTWLATRTVLAVVVVAGLAIDAYVHFDLASTYQGVKSDVVSQGDLFRAEGAVAVLAAAALLARPRRYTAAIAFLVAAGGAAAVLLYRYVDVGAFGPLPNMYEPVWYPKKTLSAWAEGVAALAALALLIAIHLRARRTTHTAGRRFPVVNARATEHDTERRADHGQSAQT